MDAGARATEIASFELGYEREPGRCVRVRAFAPHSAQRSEVPCPHVLIVHGFKGFQRWGFFPEFAARLARNGIAAVTFDLSGSGIGPDGETFADDDAFARNTYTRELEDIDRVRAHILSGALPWIDPDRAGILGHSRGGGMALIHAAERGDYAAVVTWAAIGRVDPWDEPTRALWRRQGFITVHNARTGRHHRLDVTLLEDVERNRERLDLRAACARLASPTLLIHGTDDDAVPFAALDRLARAFQPGVARVLAVEGTGHTFGARHPFAVTTPALERVLGATVGWFVEHLGLRAA